MVRCSPSESSFFVVLVIHSFSSRRQSSLRRVHREQSCDVRPGSLRSHLTFSLRQLEQALLARVGLFWSSVMLRLSRLVGRA